MSTEMIEYDDEYTPIRNERDVCKYCRRDFGGTVGDKSKMETRTIICGSCSALSGSERKEIRRRAKENV